MFLSAHQDPRVVILEQVIQMKPAGAGSGLRNLLFLPGRKMLHT